MNFIHNRVLLGKMRKLMVKLIFFKEWEMIYHQEINFSIFFAWISESNLRYFNIIHLNQLFSFHTLSFIHSHAKLKSKQIEASFDFHWFIIFFHLHAILKFLLNPFSISFVNVLLQKRFLKSQNAINVAHKTTHTINLLMATFISFDLRHFNFLDSRE